MWRCWQPALLLCFLFPRRPTDVGFGVFREADHKHTLSLSWSWEARLLQPLDRYPSLGLFPTCCLLSPCPPIDILVLSHSAGEHEGRRLHHPPSSNSERRTQQQIIDDRKSNAPKASFFPSVHRYPLTNCFDQLEFNRCFSCHFTSNTWQAAPHEHQMSSPDN